jgi:hypothetical protein
MGDRNDEGRMGHGWQRQERVFAQVLYRATETTPISIPSCSLTILVYTKMRTKYN